MTRDQIIQLADELRELDDLRSEVQSLRAEVEGLRYERDLFHAIGGAENDIEEVVIICRTTDDGEWSSYALEDYPWAKVVAETDEFNDRLRKLAEKALLHKNATRIAQEMGSNHLPLWQQSDCIQRNAKHEAGYPMEEVVK